MRKCRDDHSFRYARTWDGDEHLSCSKCGTVFFDSRNQLTYQERRDLIAGVFGALIGLPFLWAFIWLLWVAFG